ncbi:SGNH/GDSL hydrolase family protein [Rhodopila globiformis]|uniref:PEP-CTERM protein-sorting domain-containing protein n=1 Tax=Rhodopila globiformis TaxID=1071 RepID=A0A2S6N3L8_RHOGL|nr:SGNH/GDSL hydrolase family protein [Rhodopila globiformis]PPQ29210.1 hypothetical protein CCS01_22130 [Rhodopila globiformis]
MRMRRGAASVAGMLAFLALPMTAQAYSALYVFGDSLSDAGNVYIATSGTGAQQPVAPYANGQYSNGPTWVQDLAQNLGLGSVTASLAGGTDYAFGGSTTGYAITGVLPATSVPTLTQQIGTFSTAVGGAASSTALYAVWSGANDLFAILGSGASNAAAAAAAGAAATEAGAIATLAGMGAKDFVVPLLPDLGQTPAMTAVTGASALATALAAAYNASLVSDIQSLVAGTGISVSLVDTFSLIDAAVADPSAYGFTNVTAPCYVGPYTGGGTVCATPNQYLFWDGVHPTAAGQAIVAAAAEAALPEPGTLAVLGCGLAGLGALRTRRHRR